jgi:transcriptional regulator with XRE-family HTH domain
MARKSESNVKLCRAAIDELRLTKGLSVNALAAKANVNPRTAQRALKGQSVALDTVQRMAQALGLLDCRQLMYPQNRAPDDCQDHESQSDQPAQFVKFVIPIQASLPSAADQARFLRLIAEIIEIVGPIVIIDVADGSIVFTVQFQNLRDVQELVVAFCNFKLVRLAVESIFVSPDIDFVELMPRISGGIHMVHPALEIEGNLGRTIKVRRVGRTALSPGSWFFQLLLPLDEKERSAFFESTWHAAMTPTSGQSASKPRD